MPAKTWEVAETPEDAHTYTLKPQDGPYLIVIDGKYLWVKVPVPAATDGKKKHDPITVTPRVAMRAPDSL